MGRGRGGPAHVAAPRQPGPRAGWRHHAVPAVPPASSQLLPLPLPPPKVHVFDAMAGRHVASYPGHRDIVSGLVFREGSHTLFSSSFDRTVKIWSVDDGVYGVRGAAAGGTRAGWGGGAACRAASWGRRERQGGASSSPQSSSSHARRPLIHRPTHPHPPPPPSRHAVWPPGRDLRRRRAAPGARGDVRPRPHVPRVEGAGGEPPRVPRAPPRHRLLQVRARGARRRPLPRARRLAGGRAPQPAVQPFG
jgi:hypothetical protein